MYKIRFKQRGFVSGDLTDSQEHQRIHLDDFFFFLQNPRGLLSFVHQLWMLSNTVWTNWYASSNQPRNYCHWT